jgi:hypothetical protein
LAGFFIGIATATKYNGLAVGITIVSAHWLFLAREQPRDRKAYFFDARLVLGIAMVGVGFVAGNPFSVLDYRTFKSDFLYNYIVAPVYEGQTGYSYGRFFSAMIELIGVPAFVVLSIEVLVSMYSTLWIRAERIQWSTMLLCLSAFALYYVKFGAFPRLETRFVLPIMPFWLILSGPFWSKAGCFKLALPVVLVALLGYNLVCSFYVGFRFLEDPRIAAEAWVRQNIHRAGTIESDIYSPAWRARENELRDVRMPFVSGRERLFERLFKDNSFILGPKENRQKTDEMLRWYSLDELLTRKPDFIAADSLYYGRFTDPGVRRKLYPSMAVFYEALLNEQYPYKIIFDKESSAVPVWVYPREIDFLHNRITILAKTDR